MRHGKKINHLGRQKGHRDAMLSNLAASLIMNKRINTTVAKAKALRGYVEPLITRSKEDTTHSRRMVFSYLQNKSAVAELFRDVAPKVAERPGGYTRIIRLENRLGDNAEMCMMELVDFNELLLGGREAKKAKTTRRGRKKTATAATKETSTEAIASEASAESTAEEKPKKTAGKKKKSDQKKDEE
jgi:large subunit ribosomal protein L17